MRIAVVGSGVAGLVSAWLLSRKNEVTLFEADNRLGGHVHTHDIDLHGQRYAIDTGFIVHNPRNYPLLTRLFSELGIRSKPTTMSFSVRNERTGLEYNAGTLNQLFCQRRNLLAPRFLGMLRDLVRFYREAPKLLESQDAGPTLEEYLTAGCFGPAFRDEHLIPMASALWSAPAANILKFPARYLVQFMANHQMLQLTGREPWWVVNGGSAEYVRALRCRWNVNERLSTPIRAINRTQHKVNVVTDHSREQFDHVVIACHSDQALALLADASDSERDVLGTIPYQSNETILHTDSALLPRSRRAWAAWNALIPAGVAADCNVSYCMNVLQGIHSPEPFIVTLNPTRQIHPAKVLSRMSYSHPVYSHASVAAQARKPEIQGMRRTWFAGAYWGWGFHEDGVRSAVEVADALGARWDAPQHSANVSAAVAYAEAS